MADGYQNARTYWEMYEGVIADGLTQRVRALDVTMQVGGHRAQAYPYFQVSIYGRENVNRPNLVTIFRENIDNTASWRTVKVRESIDHPDVRCIVLRVEAKEEGYDPPEVSTYERNYNDQYETADLPPWGVRITEVAVYGSALKRNLRADLIIADILSGDGFTYAGPAATWSPDQLAFSDLPKDRWEALDEMNGMLGWNYACWDGEEVEYALPRSGAVIPLSTADPRTTWNIDKNLDETFNEVRVQFTTRRGKKREIVEHADSSPLGIVRADTLQAPDSIMSATSASRFGRRYLAAHSKLQTYGTVSITGYDAARDGIDPLLVRPGDVLAITGPARGLNGRQEVTRVTLRPLDWTAEVQFGANSKRFDTWLARLAVGAKAIKRR